MAAAYSTGVATDPTDLLSKLVTFLTGQGWTSDSFVTDGTGKRAHLHKGSDYVNLRSHVAENVWPNVQVFLPSTGIALYMGTGYSGASAWSLQAGAPKASGTSDSVGGTMRLASGAISAYHFFDNGSDGIMVVVERSGGLFAHLGFGRTFSKAGTWTGGPYFFASAAAAYGGDAAPVLGDDSNSAAPPFSIIGARSTSSNQRGAAAFVRVDVDAFTGKWVGFSAVSTTPADGYTGKRGHAGIEYITANFTTPPDIPNYVQLCDRLVSTLNSQAELLPVRAYVERDAGGWSLIGACPDVYVTSAVGQGFAASSLYTVNGKTFMLFPNFAVRKYA